MRELETNPLFNSGRVSALTAKGTVEMEASIMDGTKRRCGAVSGVTTVKNPVSLARLVMEKSPHSYLGFSGAEEFAREQVRVNYINNYMYSINAYFFEVIVILVLECVTNRSYYDYLNPYYIIWLNTDILSLDTYS